MTRAIGRLLASAASMAVIVIGSGAQAITITGTTDGATLANALIGPGISIVAGTETYSGLADQSGTFTNGTSAVGFANGVVLTTGNVGDVPGPNVDPGPGGRETVGDNFISSSDDISTDLGTSGDSNLDSLAGFTTFDAAVLEFKFQFGDGTVGGDLFFNFVFASEEYVNFIGSQFNDVFGFFVDGTNIALVPGTSDAITVNTINNTANSGYYVNNVANESGIPVAGRDTSFDGMTTVITAQSLGLGSGEHTMKFAVADTSDGLLDAGVFLQAGTFSSERITVPEPATLALFGIGLAGLGVMRRRQKAT